MFLCVALAVASYLFYKWVMSKYEFFEKRGIPYAKPTFLLGSNTNMFFNKKSFPEIVEIWYKKEEVKDAKICGIFEFLRPIYLVRDPKLAKTLTIKDFEHFTDHRGIIDEKVDKMFGNSLFSMKGQKWKDMRSTLSPMFTGSKMRMMYNYVASVGLQTATTMKEQIKNGGNSEIEFKDLAGKFTVDVIASTAFGIEVNSFKNPDNDFQKIAKKVTDFTGWKPTVKLALFMFAPAIMKLLKIQFFDKEIDVFFQEAITETMKIREEKGIIRNDMIHLLMQAKKGSLTEDAKDDGKQVEGFATVEESKLTKSTRVWEDDELAAQCFLFFLGGFDTVSTTMSFMAYELAVNPDIQERLYEEIKALNDSLDGKAVNYEQIQGLQYMDQVLCETLRLWPPAPGTDRGCTKDLELEVDGVKFTIEKGTLLLLPFQGYHRDPKYFPDPTKFDPERFSEENRKSIDPDTYLPFGIGPRNCIGSRFALMELKTIIYYMLLNFSFEVTAKTQIPLKLLQIPVGIKTEKGIWMALKPRD